MNPARCLEGNDLRLLSCHDSNHYRVKERSGSEVFALYALLAASGIFKGVSKEEILKKRGRIVIGIGEGVECGFRGARERLATMDGD